MTNAASVRIAAAVAVIASAGCWLGGPAATPARGAMVLQSGVLHLEALSTGSPLGNPADVPMAANGAPVQHSVTVFGTSTSASTTVDASLQNDRLELRSAGWVSAPRINNIERFALFDAEATVTFQQTIDAWLAGDLDLTRPGSTSDGPTNTSGTVTVRSAAGVTMMDLHGIATNHLSPTLTPAPDGVATVFFPAGTYTVTWDHFAQSTLSFGETTMGFVLTPAVPEPTSAAALVAATTVAAARRRRRGPRAG